MLGLGEAAKWLGATKAVPEWFLRQHVELCARRGSAGSVAYVKPGDWNTLHPEVRHDTFTVFIQQRLRP